jgi:endonuclease/exonuclease/phosphatase family metal-dependent hydrolase
LRDSLGKEYPYASFQGYHGKYKAEGFGFLSRLPLDKFELTPPDQGIFGFYSAELQLDNRAVRIVTVHLQPISLWKKATGIREALSGVGSAEKVHRSEIEAVLAKIDESVPTIIAGDFNSISTFAAPGALLSKGFADSFAETTKNPESFVTWHWPTGTGEIAFRIDYLFHSKHFQATESNVIKSDASDHYLIFSRLKCMDQ